MVFPFIGGWVVLVLASNYAMLLIGRFLTGFSGGAFVLAAPEYTADIAEPKYAEEERKIMLILFFLLSGTGVRLVAPCS